ncbi:Hsp70 family protein [Oceaniglobus ichthyenteri]|uniref:Hsp70 family protein n=1 Tax=Oceaniglobus ichthyenteri TaxID=2136177 RepID=UPI001F0C18F0|nr:Hsp70 family protein [Oceaniglobus ichthyenteri]
MNTLGIDFGTSNSACGVLVHGRPQLIEIESGKSTMPTSVFFDFDTRRTLFGTAANHALIDGAEGRFMRALKSVLGTSLMRERRKIINETLDFIDIIARFLAQMKSAAERACQTEFTHALSGRPVHFHSGNAAKDAQALTDLRECYLRAGFTDVAFLFEPEAAALANGATDGALGLIVDIGGGTSDFTLFRGAQILASHGVRIGGTNFDKSLSLNHVMPLLGAGGMLRNAFGDGVLPAPVGLWQDLATWEKIPFLYAAKTRRDVAAMARQAVDSSPFQRLQDVLEMETGHDIAFAVERGKIAANDSEGTIDLGVIEPQLSIPVSQEDLNLTLRDLTSDIRTAAQDTCTLGKVDVADVEQIVFVGGSSLLGGITQSMSDLFPKAIQKRSDPFTGVVDGLAIASAKAF